MEIRSIDTFLAYLERVRGRTKRVLACIPRDKMDWTYKEGKFTFADLIRHLGAIERYMYAENVSGGQSRYPGHGKDLADGYDPVMAYLDETHTEAVKIFAALSPDQLNSKCITPGGGRISVWKWLRAMIEHEVHHRGQIYLYLSMLGVPGPPLYGLTEEEVVENSEP